MRDIQTPIKRMEMMIASWKGTQTIPLQRVWTCVCILELRLSEPRGESIVAGWDEVGRTPDSSSLWHEANFLYI